MKKLLPMILLIFLIMLGTSFLIPVLRMVWFPPGKMGMMMEKHMMIHHMFFLFSQSFGIIFIFAGLFILFGMIKNKKEKKN